MVFRILTYVYVYRSWLVCSDEMDIGSESEEATNYHQILEFFEMCANLITTLAR